MVPGGGSGMRGDVPVPWYSGTMMPSAWGDGTSLCFFISVFTPSVTPCVDNIPQINSINAVRVYTNVQASPLCFVQARFGPKIRYTQAS